MADREINFYRNRILRSLPDRELERIQPFLRHVSLGTRYCLQQRNRKIETAYFIESGLASVVASSSDRSLQAEVGIIGRDGLVGLTLSQSVDRSPCEVFVQVAGSAMSIAIHDLKSVLIHNVSTSAQLQNFAHVFAVQSACTALANARGSIEQRLARWLLMAQDRIEADELPVTHEFLSLMLGVRRAGVTTALQDLTRRAQISTTRGTIRVLSRAGLIESCKGLYGQPEAEYARLFGDLNGPLTNLAH